MRMSTVRRSAVAVVALFALAPQASERDALRSLYEALRGGQWEHREGWLSDAPLGEWHGVTVRDGHVVEIDLAGNHLVGPLPEDLGEQGRLSQLEVLDLRWNTIWNVIPDSIAEMASLESLLLSGNQLSGHIPPSLGSMPKLKRLDLSHNQLTGEVPKELGESRSLRALGLQHNRLTGSLPKELARIGTLQRLIAHGNELAAAVPHEIDRLGQAIHMKLTDAGARKGAAATAAAIRDLDAAKTAVGFPEEIGGLDVLDETTFMMDEETIDLIRRVMAAIVVRDGELHVDSTVALFPFEADQLKRVIEQVNQTLRETGETIRSVTDLERVFELHDPGTVEIQNDPVEVNYPGSESIFEAGFDTPPLGPSSPPSPTSPAVEQQGNVGFIWARVTCPKTKANRAHVSKTAPGSIIGKGQVNCIYLSGPPQTLTYAAISYLQRWHSSSWWVSHWRSVGTPGRVVKQGTNVHIAQRKLVAKTPCRSGIYRTRLSLYITGNVTGRFFPHPGRYASAGERVSC